MTSNRVFDTVAVRPFRVIRYGDSGELVVLGGSQKCPMPDDCKGVTGCFSSLLISSSLSLLMLEGIQLGSSSQTKLRAKN